MRIICKSKSIGHFKNDFIDYNRKSLSDWVIKKNDYTGETDQLIKGDQTYYNFFASQYERKRWIRKNISNKLLPIFRPKIYFIHRYFL